MHVITFCEWVVLFSYLLRLWLQLTFAVLHSKPDLCVEMEPHPSPTCMAGCASYSQVILAQYANLGNMQINTFLPGRLAVV